MGLIEISVYTSNWVDSAQDESLCESDIEPPGFIRIGVSSELYSTESLFYWKGFFGQIIIRCQVSLPK